MMRTKPPKPIKKKPKPNAARNKHVNWGYNDGIHNAPKKRTR